MKKILLAVLMVLPLTVFAQVKLAHVNSQEIVMAMPETAAAQKTLKDLQDKYTQEIKRTQDELQKKFAEYQKAISDSGDKLPANIQDRRRKELEDMSQRAQQFQSEAQQNLQNKEQELMQPIFKKLGDAISAVGTAGGYTYIIDLARTPLAYVSPSATDVTANVKTKLGIK
ncbi:MAG TPA: OmpH family outer membrane protein [Bacteroidaceae bacterium]|nr:OmpH family outer membrane protein [Bacteroidaceae bacterium]